MITFKDLYDSVRGLEKSILGIDQDLPNMCGSDSACIITEEQQRLVDVYQELISADVFLGDMDVNMLLTKVEECTACISLAEYDPVIPVKPPVATITNCEIGITIDLAYISRFLIYERTEGGASAIEVYVVGSDALPYWFEPDTGTDSYERYDLSWSVAYQGLIIDLDHSVDVDYPVPAGSYNIVKIVAELNTVGQELYGVSNLTACEAFLLTDGVQWEYNHGLDKTIDGNNTTYSKLSNQLDKVSVGFRFKF